MVVKRSSVVEGVFTPAAITGCWGALGDVPRIPPGQRARRAVLLPPLAPALVLLATGCSDFGSRLGVGAGVRPLNMAGRSDMRGKLLSDGMGAEVIVTRDEGVSSIGVGLTYTPMRNCRTGEQVEVYTADYLGRVRFTDDPPGPFVLIGGGWSGVCMDFTEHDDFFGIGPYAKVGTGLTGRRGHLDIFWDARAWLGADRHRFRAAAATTVGVTLSVSF